ncbi:fibronectin type III domain-containing protein, partial [Candidatus Pacearchaeota archaeon]|nr:fibronectin type III domain-containing protein [Candidatus Pacearchaeota archaeon]
APSNLAATATDYNKISLVWTDNSNNEDKFIIERSTDGISFTQIITVPANNISYTDTGLSCLTTYYYRVKAANSVGESGYTNIVNVKTPAQPIPSAPTNLAGTATSTSVSLTWVDNSINENGFSIERKSGAGSYSQIDYVSSNINLYTDTNVVAGTTYYYRVLAFNCGGNSAYTNELTILVPVVVTIPAAPTNLKVGTVTSTSVPLSWTDNSNNEDRFIIERSAISSTSGFAQLTVTAANYVSYVDTSALPGSTYYYRVKTSNTAGDSSYSNVVSATPPASTCSDGTPYSSCSSTKPKYCDAGTLIDKCSQCGCPLDQTCNTATNLCYVPSSSCKYLISYDRDGGVTPAYLTSSKVASIESLSNFPYDGIVIRTSIWNLMRSGVVLDPATVASELAPLKTLRPSKLKHNFIIVRLHYPGTAVDGSGDFFDDAAWNRVANNFKILAQAISDVKAAGFPIDGIMFDNEGPYDGTCLYDMWDYPSGDGNKSCVAYTSTKSLSAYQAKSRARGKQVMDKILESSFKDIKMLTFLDAYFSCTNNNQHTYDNFWLGNELLGSFTLGLAEGTVGTNAKVTDGGEYSYYAHVSTDGSDIFQRRYNYRKTGMPSDSACPFITYAESSSLYPDFRTKWASTLNVGHGLMNGSSSSGTQTMATIQADATAALQNTDDYVWLYMENVNSIDPSLSKYVGSTWMNKVINARIAAGNRC